jgi:hypothetical protein
MEKTLMMRRDFIKSTSLAALPLLLLITWDVEGKVTIAYLPYLPPKPGIEKLLMCGYKRGGSLILSVFIPTMIFFSQSIDSLHQSRSEG